MAQIRKTKIVCTIGPASANPETIRKMITSGMDVARLNFSHGDHEGHKLTADMIKQARAELGTHTALLLDTKGPEIRIGQLVEPVVLERDAEFKLVFDDIIGDATQVSVTYKELWRDVSAGSRILIDDGLIELKVTETNCSGITCRVVNGGRISNRKGVNVPGVKLSLPFLSERDISDIEFGIAEDFDFIAASFTQCAADIISIRDLLEKRDCHNIRIIAKIENAAGVENIDEIIKVADAIMVARGDMGVEIPMQDIPIVQKRLISKAYSAGKPAITATQMLESMTKNPRPTRAEITDVANAIYDGTSAIMLSGETAAGSYPVESVAMMSSIATRTESDISYTERFARMQSGFSNVTTAISHAACTTANDLGANAIITVTKSGQTARMISRFRPETPIIGCSPSEKVCRQLSLSWGVSPLHIEEQTNSDSLFDHALDRAYENKLVDYGDLAVITAGLPLGVAGTTNILKVQIVGDVLTSGTGIAAWGVESVCGTICVCRDEDEMRQKFKGDEIIVIPSTSNKVIDLLRHARGIICEIDGDDSHAAIVGQALGIPVIVGALGATRILKNGTAVTLDAKRGMVYCGR